MSGLVEGKVGLVTGAGSGIGRATAELLAREGAQVLVCDVDEAGGEAAAKAIEAAGGRARFLRTDVTSEADVEAAVRACVEGGGRLDFAVNNAGIEGQLAGITELSEADWDQVLDINLKGTFLSMKYESRAMLEAGHGGAIVNVGSVNSFLGYPTGAAYVASKHGLVGLTSSVSAELAPQGIRVNIVCPGMIETPMHHRIRGLIGDAVYDEVLLPQVHLRRAGQPEEIASAILFLCSPEASYITGTTLTPDGGYTLTM